MASKNDTDNDKNIEFSPEIAAAFASYPQPGAPRGFEARFWSQFEGRRARYRGVWGYGRRIVEIEIEGVAVWRLAASTFSGGALCGLFFLAALTSSRPETAPLQVPSRAPETPLMAFDARRFYAREWEEARFGLRPRKAPRFLPKTNQGGEISWLGKKNGWV